MLPILWAMLGADPGRSQPPRRGLELAVAVGAEGACQIRWAGEPITVAELDQRARRRLDKKAAVTITSAAAVPYRCVGGVIFTLQRAGFARVGFVAEPPPPRVVVRADRRCRLWVNGQRTDWVGLQRHADAWTAAAPELHVRPSPGASYACVARILAILRPTGALPVAWLGNAAPAR